MFTALEAFVTRDTRLLMICNSGSINQAGVQTLPEHVS